MQDAPCLWPVTYVGAACPDLVGAPEQAIFEEIATTLLWNWTKRAYGICPLSVRPCRADCRQSATFWGAGPYPGYTANGLICGRCGGNDSCSCPATEAIGLPPPVWDIDSVVVDGIALPPESYRVDESRWLVRLDGGVWPICQDMSLAPTQPGTWMVSYQRGREVPLGGQIAAGLLACELALASVDDSSCRLPAGLQSVVRQGVSATVASGGETPGDSGTGIWLIDSWVASVTESPTGGSVRSVDVKRKHLAWPTP